MTSTQGLPEMTSTLPLLVECRGAAACLVLHGEHVLLVAVVVGVALEALADAGRGVARAAVGALRHVVVRVGAGSNLRDDADGRGAKGAVARLVQGLAARFGVTRDVGTHVDRGAEGAALGGDEVARGSDGGDGGELVALDVVFLQDRVADGEVEQLPAAAERVAPRHGSTDSAERAADIDDRSSQRLNVRS